MTHSTSTATSSLCEDIGALLADVYVLCLKTQNYHWHVLGPHFHAWHALFETQYRELFEQADALAEAVRKMGHVVPATFQDFLRLKRLSEGISNIAPHQMLLDLAHDHTVLLGHVKQALKRAQEASEEGLVALLTDQWMMHDKAIWVLNASAVSG